MFYHFQDNHVLFAACNFRVILINPFVSILTVNQNNKNWMSLDTYQAIINKLLEVSATTPQFIKYERFRS